MVLYQVGSSDMRRSKVARVNVRANTTRYTPESLRFFLVGASSWTWSCFREFRMKYQEKKDQTARYRRFRATKKRDERYPSFAMSFAPNPWVAAGLDQM